MKKILLLTLFLMPLLSSAEETTVIYRSTDKHGNPVFSDRPQPGATELELAPTNRTPATAVPQRDSTTKKEPAKPAYQVSITNPVDGSFFANGLVATPVNVVVTPPLLPLHQLEIQLDGQTVSKGSLNTSIPRLRPGSHRISAIVVDRDGKALGPSDSVTVSAQWPGKK